MNVLKRLVADEKKDADDERAAEEQQVAEQRNAINVLTVP